jgi:hypothetical protein
MQKGASATASYSQASRISILKFPEGNEKRNLLMLEPNIRAFLKTPRDLFRFYIEAGYTMPFHDQEFSYTFRPLSNVNDKVEDIDIKALMNTKEVTVNEKIIPAFASVGGRM